MRIGGFVPFTSIDYPGELAAVVFCQGCPWRCSYCHNTHLLPGNSDSLLDWDEILQNLEQRRGFLDAVVFSGGEPCAQRDLPRAVTQVRSMGYKVGLHTAGAYPRRLADLLPMLDWVGLDIKELPERYESVTGIPGSGEKAWYSLELLLKAPVPFQVRTTLYPGMPDGHPARLDQRLTELGVEDHCYQDCRPVPVRQQTGSLPRCT
jgi:pyruvate formate lyase activating enzyme